MDFESYNNNITEENNNNNNDHGWQKVTYAKKKKKNNNNQVPPNSISNGSVVSASNNNAIGVSDNVFDEIERKAEQRRKVIEAQRSAVVDDDEDDDRKVRSRSGGSGGRKEYGEYEESDEEGGEKRLDVKDGVVEKKKKVKKVKKPKVTVAEAAARIDAEDLARFLVDVTTSFEGQQDIQLMRFADYFGRAFADVTASQFPWVKLFRESPVSKIADNPVSHIPEAVYKTSVDWISKRSIDALGSFVLWSIDSILADLTNQLGGAKGSKKGAQNTSSKSQVGLFVVLAMVLRRRPDVLINALPTLNEILKSQGQDKLPVIVWMVTQASQGDLAVGLYLWSHLVLPIVATKSGSNPQTRDLILQLVERVLSAPKAENILVNGAVRKGERLLPPSALDLLLRATFPSSSARVKATERFEAVYPTLKKVALAGSPGSKSMKQVSQQMMTVSLKACGEGIPELSHEASSIFIWCLNQNPDCCKQWDNYYLDNLEASTIILRRLNEQWKELSLNPSSLEALTATLKSLKKKNEKAMTEGGKSGSQALYKESDKHCKALLGRLSRGSGCAKATVVLAVAVSVGVIYMRSTILESLDWVKLSEVLSTKQFI